VLVAMTDSPGGSAGSWVSSFCAAFVSKGSLGPEGSASGHEPGAWVLSGRQVIRSEPDERGADFI
jgi:hypothetical protein